MNDSVRRWSLRRKRSALLTDAIHGTVRVAGGRTNFLNSPKLGSDFRALDFHDARLRFLEKRRLCKNLPLLFGLSKLAEQTAWTKQSVGKGPRCRLCLQKGPDAVLNRFRH